MIKSESITELSKALSKAQACIKGAIADSDNPFFKSKYADLASVWDACRKPLTDNGLAVIQTSTYLPEHPDMVAIETTLTHSSGEYTTGIMVAKPVKTDPQSIGSCVTYLRRYSLAAIAGISPEDDDGNAASGTKKEEHKPVTPLPQKPKNQEKDVQDFEDISEKFTKDKPEKTQAEKNRARLNILIKEAGFDRDRFKEWLVDRKSIELKEGATRVSMNDLSDEKVALFINSWSSSNPKVMTVTAAYKKWLVDQGEQAA